MVLVISGYLVPLSHVKMTRQTIAAAQATCSTFLRLVIFFLFVACFLPSLFVSAQETSLEIPGPSPPPTPSPWRCVNPDAPESDDGRIRKGSRTTVCLTVGPGSNWSEVVQYIRYVFRPTADEYSVYRVPNCEKYCVVVISWY